MLVTAIEINTGTTILDGSFNEWTVTATSCGAGQVTLYLIDPATGDESAWKGASTEVVRVA